LNRNPKSYLFAIVGAEYLLNLLPRGTHDYARFIKPSELVGFCRKAGLSPAAMSGLSYNPLSRIYCLGRDTSVNYMMQTILNV
ncbi:MAG: bifunctional 3-demethylubiquinol 3-O-methyltransferase/2-polyprenyl-6-hydroxyphenol methylase, partial [Azoarcus sp.]|jgi:2-polyprenyl-6-hydroxyphenyl methylase/3-demethylubiquinone-9 3-methyltransferase|nr:bifunctional 3-demethylubiquinol 3-O-methyltransferase/2-polyprenyl-6-hydroxyphenol methylase [Azoarcus sp.]